MQSEVANSEQDQLIVELYDRFNAKDIDLVFANLHENVEWVNEPKGVHVRGIRDLKTQWLQQWDAVAIHLTPKRIQNLNEGTLVHVQEVLTTHSGKQFFDGLVGHLYQFRDGLIARCDIVDVDPN